MTVLFDPGAEANARVLDDWAEDARKTDNTPKRHTDPSIKRARQISLELLALTDEQRRFSEQRFLGVPHNLQLDALQDAVNTEERARRFAAIDRCRLEAMLFRNEAGGSVRPKSCHCRACDTCQAQRKYRLQRVFAAKAKDFRQVKMLTLTLLSNDQPLRAQCHRIKEAFRRLRARSVWKQLVRGGWWVLEITRNKETQLWHVHIHAIIDCKYLPHDWVKREWLRVTGDSYVVHIAAITAARTAYVAKYTSKGSDIAEDSEHLWQYYEAMNRARDAQPFGECGPLGEPPRSHGETMIYCGIVSSIISAARCGCSWAVELLPTLNNALSKSPGFEPRQEPTVP